MNEINQINNEQGRKSRILLVDDEPGLRTAVKTFLEDEGFEIFIAVDGEDGWEKAQTFFPDLITFMTSGPIQVQILEGDDAISKYREVMGNTNPKEASPGTLRADFADSIDANAVHGSDSEVSAAREISYFFSD